MCPLEDRTRVSPEFNKAGYSAELKAGVTPQQLQQAEKVKHRANDLLERSKAHCMRHRRDWIDKEFRKLARQDQPRLEHTPPGMTADRTGTLSARAIAKVDQRIDARHGRLERIRENPLEQVRHSGRDGR